MSLGRILFLWDGKGQNRVSNKDVGANNNREKNSKYEQYIIAIFLIVKVLEQ